MYQAIITDREAGQRLDKYLHRILPNAGSGFLYKMLRKKNITLNDKKAEGSEKVVSGDLVKIYFADETLGKFMGRRLSDSASSASCVAHGTESASSFEEKEAVEAFSSGIREYMAAYYEIEGIKVLYENDHILLADKPFGVLSQKAEKTDLSLNEWLVGYLLSSGFMGEEGLITFKPSVCNRLDRNTGGIVFCAKSLRGAQLFGRLLKDRTLHKYYQLYVKGRAAEEQLIDGYLYKDEKHNKVSVVSADELAFHAVAEQAKGRERPAYIKTAYKPLMVERDKTLLEVELITGKPHQIRAHLASIGHPLLGDYKYGDRAWNDSYRKKYQVASQLLYAYKVEFPKLDAPFEDISGRVFCAELPEIFRLVSDRNV